ncbi:hypothetical protein [Comamonas sp. JC664]|uniref:hypothetical protein n=1 Tax=Comamonas sp. JC664 TaxID=2801917 RepID=UPI00174D893D|nr:hypothetical protein [Comamonas sp. JC664]MBL0698976.1 hypothetical protein [Comamonas sp. JC664]
METQQSGFVCGECMEERPSAAATSLTSRGGMGVCRQCEVDVVLERVERGALDGLRHEFATKENADRALDEAPMSSAMGEVAEDGRTVTFTQ